MNWQEYEDFWHRKWEKIFSALSETVFFYTRFRFEFENSPIYPFFAFYSSFKKQFSSVTIKKGSNKNRPVFLATQKDILRHSFSPIIFFWVGSQCIFINQFSKILEIFLKWSLGGRLY